MSSQRANRWTRFCASNPGWPYDSPNRQVHYPPLNLDTACIVFRSLPSFVFLGSAQRPGAGGVGNLPSLGRPMNKALILAGSLASGSLQARSTPATGIWRVRWAFSLLPIALGLILHLLTLSVTFIFVRDCIQHGQFKHRSGVPFAGPLLICLGLWWSPSHLPAWVFLLPWGLEFLATLISIVVQHVTKAKPV